MVYIDLPSLTPGSDVYTGIVAHELQHLVDYNGDGNGELVGQRGIVGGGRRSGADRELNE